MRGHVRKHREELSRRMRRLYLREVGLALLVIVLCLGTQYSGQSSDWTPALAEATVSRVVDGDTIKAHLNGQEITVRLIGVDTPETVHPTKPVEALGKEASAFTRTALEGKKVWLEFDVGQQDRYGRLLAYVWTSPPKEWSDVEIREHMHNAVLLLEGYAQLMTVPPNVRYVDQFTVYQTEAREAGRGLWGLESPLDNDSDVQAGCVNLNTASLEELQRIIHIGPERAQAIVDGRPWRSVDELIRISGIGQARLKDIKEQGLACVE